MARRLFTVEQGLQIVDENGFAGPSMLKGSGNPGGDTGEQDDAGVGSIYLKTGAGGGLYKKIADANSAADWEEVGNVALDEISWRNETVIAVTDDTLSAGTGIDPNGWTDNDQGLGGNDMVVGQIVIGDFNGTPAPFEVTVITSDTNITLAAYTPAIASNDTFVVQNHLPDSPAAQEAQSIVHFPVAGSPGIKIADFNWSLADGINLTGGYAAANGTVAAGDTVEAAIQKLDGNQADLITLSGEAQGAVDHGTFTGAIIEDNRDTHEALQDLEDSASNLVTLSGEALDAVDHGTFTGSTIPDNSTTHEALQALETASEASQVTGKVTGVTTLQDIDTVLVDDFHEVEWELVAFEEASPAKKKFQKLGVLHDGTASADAANTDIDVFAKKKLGSNFDVNYSIDFNGTGAAQTMRLRASSSTAGVTIEFRRNGVLIG